MQQWLDCAGASSLNKSTLDTHISETPFKIKPRSKTEKTPSSLNNYWRLPSEK